MAWRYNPQPVLVFNLLKLNRPCTLPHFSCYFSSWRAHWIKIILSERQKQLSAPKNIQKLKRIESMYYFESQVFDYYMILIYLLDLVTSKFMNKYGLFSCVMHLQCRVRLIQSSLYWNTLCAILTFVIPFQFVCLGKVSIKKNIKSYGIFHPNCTPPPLLWKKTHILYTIFVCLYLVYNHQIWREL